MSNATGIVYLPRPEGSSADYGDVVGYYIYQGTCDTACTRIHPTSDEAWDHNRTDGAYAECTCGNPPTPVVLYSQYGNGFSWDSSACLTCRAITGYRSEHEEFYEKENKDYWGFGQSSESAS